MDAAQSDGFESLMSLIGTVTAPTLVGLFVIAILVGRLVPRSVMIARMQDKDRLIEEIKDAYGVVKTNNELLLRGNETAVRISDATAEVVGAKKNE